MTNEEKAKLYESQEWALYINGLFYSTYPSHDAAKKAMFLKKNAFYGNWDDECLFEIKPYNK